MPLLVLHHSFHTLHRLPSSFPIIYSRRITPPIHPKPKHQIFKQIFFPKPSSSLIYQLLTTMALHHAKKILRRSLSIGKESVKTQKGHVAVYVGEEGERKRYTIPVSYLNQPLFLDLLSRAEEEFGYDHPMGGLTIPCSEDSFFALISQLRE